MMKYQNIATLLLPLILMPYGIFADEVKVNNFRCGNKLIAYNMTMDEVLKACPKSQHPKRQSKNKITYYYLTQGGSVQYKQSYQYKWFFESYGKFRRYVRFYHDQVVLITEDHAIRD